jgi:hypothetical protein
MVAYGRADKLVAWGMLLSACAVLAVAAWLQPSPAGYGTHTQLGLPPCNFLRLTHLPCPSCGMTTCFTWMVRGQIAKAFLANPFGILAFLGTVTTIPAAIVLLWRRISFRRITEGAHFTKAVYAATALYFLSWMFKLAELGF